MKLRFVGLLILGLFAGDPATAAVFGGSSGFPAPNGLRPCAPGDPVAGMEARVIAKLGGDFLGCLWSGQTTFVQGKPDVVPTPREYAFAIAVPGNGYTSADLDKLRSKVADQWKNFDPLSKEFKEAYTARINELIKGDGPASSATLSSVKPVLVSIDRLDDKSYSVTSIRRYVFEIDGGRVGRTKVNSDVVARRGSELIRLTIQRTLTGPSDVSQVQGEIADWARAITRNPPSLPGRK